MFTSIRAKLGIIFLGFLLLGAGSITATFVTIKAQAADALVINLAGRQRMLTQEMTKAALGVARDPTSDYRVELNESAYLFDRTLTALLEGGSTLYGSETVTLPPAMGVSIRTQLATVTELWDRFGQEIETVQTADPESAAFAQAVGEIESLSLVILPEMDRAVQLYEAVAESKLTRLRVIQTIFAVSAVGLLVAGYVTTQRTIATPISALEAMTRRIAGGDMESPVEVAPMASDEVRTLAQSFEDMRHDLAASRLELARWAAELESRVERRTEQLAVLLEVSTEVSSKLEIQQVLELVVEKTRHLARGDVAVLCLLDPSDEALTVAAVSGSEEALAAHLGPAIRCSALRVAHTGEATILPDDCDCYFLSPQFRHSHLMVPLRIGERMLGVLCVGHRAESRFGEEEARLLTLLANAGAVALENARLYGRAEQTATLMERERIVAEIHDGLAQTLGFMALRLDAATGLIENENLAELPEHLGLMQRTVEQANREVRRLMADLRADPQSRRTLGGLLEQIVERFGEERGMEIELQVETGQPIWAPPQVHEHVVRVVLEALINAHKHTKISRATVTLERQDGQAIVCVRDDGTGFDANSPASGQHHFGLRVMQTRAKRIGGELSVESALGQGTTVTLRWPTLRQAQDTAAEG